MSDTPSPLQGTNPPTEPLILPERMPPVTPDLFPVVNPSPPEPEPAERIPLPPSED